MGNSKLCHCNAWSPIIQLIFHIMEYHEVTEEFSIKNEQENIDGVGSFENQWRMARTDLYLYTAQNI